MNQLPYKALHVRKDHAGYCQKAADITLAPRPNQWKNMQTLGVGKKGDRRIDILAAAIKVSPSLTYQNLEFTVRRHLVLPGSRQYAGLQP